MGYCQTKFNNAEKSGRTLFEMALQASGITNYQFTNQFDKVDVFFTADTTPYCGEIKYRRYPSTQGFFSTDGVVLEKPKYDQLKNNQYASGYTPLYIHIFEDNVCALFDLTNFDSPNWVESRAYGKTTMGDTTKVTKAVCYLPLNSASNITKIPL